MDTDVPLACLASGGHARLGQNVAAGSMKILLSWRCWGACQAGVYLDPHFCYKCVSPRLAVELPVFGGMMDFQPFDQLPSLLRRKGLIELADPMRIEVRHGAEIMSSFIRLAFWLQFLNTSQAASHPCLQHVAV